LLVGSFSTLALPFESGFSGYSAALRLKFAVGISYLMFSFSPIQVVRDATVYYFPALFQIISICVLFGHDNPA